MIPDGFYLIQGMDPFVWSMCTDVHEENRIPSVESLKSVRPDDSSIQVVLVDRRADFDLGMLENYASSFLSSSSDMKDVINQLAKLVSSRMGWAIISLSLLIWTEFCGLLNIFFMFFNHKGVQPPTKRTCFHAGKRAARQSNQVQDLLCFIWGSCRLVSASTALCFLKYVCCFIKKLSCLFVL